MVGRLASPTHGCRSAGQGRRSAIRCGDQDRMGASGRGRSMIRSGDESVARDLAGRTSASRTRSHYPRPNHRWQRQSPGEKRCRYCSRTLWADAAQVHHSRPTSVRNVSEWIGRRDICDTNSVRSRGPSQLASVTRSASAPDPCPGAGSSTNTAGARTILGCLRKRDSIYPSFRISGIRHCGSRGTDWPIPVR